MTDVEKNAKNSQISSYAQLRTQRETVRTAGHLYIDKLRWAVFLQSRGTDDVIRSLRMCDACRNAWHNRERCSHPACHGLYAATTNHEEFDQLWTQRQEGNVLAVRTGRASGIFIVDFDLKHDAPAAHDNWGEATGLPWSFPLTLRQTTKSGGFHLVYRLPTPETVIRSRNAVTLRGVDIKADGGLFVVDPTPGYSWHSRVLPTVAPPEVVEWATSAPVHRSAVSPRRTFSRLIAQCAQYRRNFVLTARSHDSGITLQEATLAGCPVGERDWFINSAAYSLRICGTSWENAVSILREEWSCLEQPPGDVFEWEWCLYKLQRIWRDVLPDHSVVAGTRWLRAAQSQCNDTRHGKTIVRRMR